MLARENGGACNCSGKYEYLLKFIHYTLTPFPLPLTRGAVAAPFLAPAIPPNVPPVAPAAKTTPPIPPQPSARNTDMNAWKRAIHKAVQRQPQKQPCAHPRATEPSFSSLLIAAGGDCTEAGCGMGIGLGVCRFFSPFFSPKLQPPPPSATTPTATSHVTRERWSSSIGPTCAFRHKI